MARFDFEDVLRATTLAGRVAESAGTTPGPVPPWAHELAAWLQLEPGAAERARAGEFPSRQEVVARLTLAVAAIDKLVGNQLDAVLHAPAFQRLEATWRGLHGLHALRTSLVGNQGEMVELRVCDLSWYELTRDIERAAEFDMSRIFQLVYSDEFDQPGGTPYGVLLGDYTITHRRSPEHRDDVGTLRGMSQVAAAAFCPFVAAADPSLLDLESFTDLERPFDLPRTFRAAEYVAWNSMRKQDDARFTGLVLPRVLMRRPYRDHPLRDDGFRYEERIRGPQDQLFGNAIWAFGEVLLRAFIEYGWMAAIRGVQRDTVGRGLVTELAHDWHAPERRGVVSRGSLEVQLTESQEHQLGELGFIPLLHCHGTRYAAFYGNQSVQDWRGLLPTEDRKSPRAASAKLSSMLQYMFCVSRFAHYVKVMAREKVGSYTGANELQSMLSNWLIQYATANVGATAAAQAKYPLRNARVEVRERPGQPGTYACKVDLQPHYQLDQLATAISLTTDLYTGYEM